MTMLKLFQPKPIIKNLPNLSSDFSDFNCIKTNAQEFKLGKVSNGRIGRKATSRSFCSCGDSFKKV
jgi:hypothetical protein